MRQNAFLRATLCAVVLCAALAGGARGLSEAPKIQTQERTPFRLTGEEGALEGVISVEGDVPPRPLIPNMEVDPACASQNKGGARVEDIVVERGRLANALVYIESPALDSYTFEPRPWVAALGRRRCRTVPHVLAVQAGQTLLVQNNDPTAHNYFFQTKVNPIYNKALSPGGSFELLFKQPEPPFVVRCNQHPWERGYVAVLPHPYFAVTGRNGAFLIQGLPPGDYEVVVWHEKFLEARAKVSVGARETKVLNFTRKFPGDVQR